MKFAIWRQFGCRKSAGDAKFRVSTAGFKETDPLKIKQDPVNDKILLRLLYLSPARKLTN